MVETSKKGRKRGALPIEPIMFPTFSEEFKERINEKETHLRAPWLWIVFTNF